MSTFAGGYAGQVLYVNLTDGSMQKKSLPRDFALKYIGGRGFSSRILWEELEVGTDPFSPENIVILATGLPLEPEALLRCGKRVYNVEKLFNLRAGFGRQADYPPQRFFQEETPDGPSKGAKLNRSEYDRVLDDYYEARGWDKRTGQPTPQKLRSLGLE